uniref:Tudor-knot domain-containing protein n=1 Tax=Lotharella oceanica TaxID=641309 RepID=A0A7S2TFT9_9EUKA
MAAEMALGAVIQSFGVIMPEFYRKTDFFCEHLLRLAEAHENCAAVLKGQPKALEAIIGFYTNYPDYKDAISKIDPVKVRKQEDPRYHMYITKANKQSKFAITHTLSSRYGPYGRSSAEKLAAFQSLAQTGSLKPGAATTNNDGYDSDDERHARNIEDIKIGQRVDVLDTARKWLLCEVVQIRGRALEVHYVDYVKDWDEWLDISSPRLCLKPETLSRLQGIYDVRN